MPHDNAAQRARFVAARARLPNVPGSLAASSGIFLGPDYHFDLVRPGAALYGVNPQPGAPNPMRPVVRLAAKILQIREIDGGESVGYGAAHVMTEPGRLATVAVGYADGWLRSFSHRGCGRIAGQRVPLVGRVSMDLASFDVTAVDPALVHPGATIELLGDDYGVSVGGHELPDPFRVVRRRRLGFRLPPHTDNGLRLVEAPRPQRNHPRTVPRSCPSRISGRRRDDDGTRCL